MEPSLKGTEFGFNGELSYPKELFRNSLIHEQIIMTSEQFENVKFEFITKETDTNQALDLTFNKIDFCEVFGESASSLVKMTMLNEIESKKLSQEEKKALSIKYQVLCSLTALVGVQKQTNSATGELIESSIRVGKGEGRKIRSNHLKN